MNWRKYLNTNHFLFANILRGLLVFGVVFLLGGCIKHPHGKYEVTTKVVSLIADKVAPENIQDDIANVELFNENSSRFVKTFNVDRKYLYESTLYFDRFVYVSEIVLRHPGELMQISVNGLDEKTFKSRNQSVNKIVVTVLIYSEESPESIMFMDVRTIRDATKESAKWMK